MKGPALAPFFAPLRNVSHLSLRVWQRNGNAYLRLWATEVWPPLVEPLLFLIALGFGLGAFVVPIQGQNFLQFIAPGIMAQSVMFAAAMECLYGSYIRMDYQKTFDAIIATPASVEDVITGEILWGTTRGLLSGAAVMLLAGLLGLLPSWQAPLGLLIALLGSFVFAALAEIFTAFSPSINFFNYAFTIFLTPMFLFGGVFFPVSSLPPLGQYLAWIAPLTHMVTPIRAIASGRFENAMFADIVWLIVVGAVSYVIAIYAMRRRLIK